MHFFCIPLAKESQYLFAFEWEAPGEKYQQMTLTVLPQGFRDSPHLFGQALSRDLLDLDLGPNGKILQKEMKRVSETSETTLNTPVFLPGKSQGRRSLVGCSPWGCEDSGMTERLSFDFSLSCIGEGNGNSLQCSCLENPRDGGAWWAAVYGVAQSRTRLKRLSSSEKST